jgi:hypothetical protein
VPEEFPHYLKTNATLTGLAMTKDFKTWIRAGWLTDPLLDDRDVVLFPEKIGGRLAMLRRPLEWVGPRYGTDQACAWISFADDLMGLAHAPARLVLKNKNPSWEVFKMGFNTPPIKTPHGWFVIYHAVGADKIYRLGAVLLDLDDPSIVRHRTPHWIMQAEADYETKGFYPGVCFPCGAVVVGGTLLVYYGGADKYCALATCDIYRRYLNPKAPARKLVRLGYLWTVIVILAGIGIGFMTGTIHGVTRWLTSALVPAFVAPNVLKWHWWRFNGWGFFAGMAAGTAAAILPAVIDMHEIVAFVLVLSISGVASVAACLTTPPESMDLLEQFYTTVRPWGFWGPVFRRCRAKNVKFQENGNFWRDVFNLLIGMIWQIAMVAMLMYLVIQNVSHMLACLAVFAATSVVLKFTWYDRLGPGEMYLDEQPNSRGR